MSRPHDWEPLAGSDPLPGDPHEIEAGARRFRDLAAELERQAAALDGLSGEGELDSEAVAQLREKAGELRGRLRRAGGRYRAVSVALEQWAPTLDQAQRAGDRALLRAQAADREVRAFLHAAVDGTVTGAPGASGSGAGPSGDGTAARLEQAEDDLRAARRELEAARELRDEGARRAEREIRRAGEGDGLDDGFLAGIGSAVAAARSFVAARAGWLTWAHGILAAASTVLGLLAVALAFMGPLAGAAAFFAILGTAAAAAALLISLVLFAAGVGGWKDVGKDAIGLVLSRLGVGPVKLASKALQDEAAVVAGTQASTALRNSLRPRIDAAERTLNNPNAGPLSRAKAQDLLDDIDRQARAAGQAAERRVDSLGAARLGRRDSKALLEGGLDSGNAQAIARAERLAAEFPAPSVVKASDEVARVVKATAPARVLGTQQGLAGLHGDIGDVRAGWSPRPDCRTMAGAR